MGDYIKFANIFWQTYKLPNYILPTFILPTLHFTKLFWCKLTIYQIHFAKLTFFRFLENLQISFILPNLHFANPSVCSNTKNGAAIILGQVRLSPPQELDSARSAGVETCQVQLAQVRCYWPIQELEHQIRGSECYYKMQVW